MKKILESIKDFIYDSIDYLIMISIVGIVVFVIGWRINILFAEKPMDQSTVNIDEVEESADNENPDRSDDGSSDLPKDEDKEIPLEEDTEEPSDDEEESSDIANGEIIKIVIPPGSLPSKIGNILESSGLVSSRDDFISKSQEMNLDTKLKSGNYDIEVGTSLENIVKIIAK